MMNFEVRKRVEEVTDLNSSSVSVETYTKETSNVIIPVTKLHFTMQIYKNYKVVIYKPLLLVKLALFFWFAGGYGIQAFFSVFLKQRGLGLAYFSLVTAASVIFQSIGSFLSGIIADKIGRPKPVLYAHMIICFLLSVGFLIIPKLTVDSTMRPFHLISRSNHSSALITEMRCSASDSLVHEETCKLYNYTITNQSPHKMNCVFDVVKENNLSEIYFNGNTMDVFENTELCCTEKSASIPISSILTTFCNYSYCNFLKDTCLYESGNSKWNGHRIFLYSVYFLLITLYYLARSCVFFFYDLSVISITEEHGADFGRQRVFAILGSLIGPSLLGYAMQATSSGNDKNYSFAFVFFNIFTVLSCLFIWKLKVPVKAPGTRLWRKCIILLKKPDIWAFIIVLLVSGTAFNFNFIFSNWYLEGLGASKMLLGMVYPLSNAFALLFLFTSKWWVQKIGVHNLFILALLSHAIFDISYSFLKEPWIAVLIGTGTSMFSYHLMWVSVMHYSNSIAPDGLYATVIVMAGAVHFMMSRISASLIGGIIMDACGGRIAFQVMGGICFVTAILYGTFHHFRRYRSFQH